MDFISAFHFLRPWWLLALVPVALLCYQFWRHYHSDSGLEAHIDAHLLQHLTMGKQQRPSPLLAIILALLGLIICLALAGPTGKQRPQPLYESESAVIILLDLSPSMRADDSKPSRIAQAHLKIQDVLRQRKDGLSALIVYAGEAHIVAPMTDDSHTISHLLPTLQPGILPIPGSNIEMAIGLAKQLMADANLPKASLLLLTDGIDKKALSSIQKQLTPAMDLTIIGVGTDAGAPIPYQGDFIKDDSGKTVIAKRNGATLKKLATQVKGYYLPIQSDTRDTDFFLRHLEQRFNTSGQQQPSERSSDSWYELGPTLILLILPLAALLFRRGWLLNLAIVGIATTAFTPLPTQASLWKNGNQQGAEAFQQQEYKGAAKAFTHPQWKGSALYKSGNYQEALDYFQQDASAIGHYNQGNALTQLQRYDEAIAAYNKALEKQPDLQSAQKNKALAEELQKQQPKQPSQQQEQQESGKDPQNKAQQGQQGDKGQSANSDQTDSQNQDGDSEPQEQQKEAQVAPQEPAEATEPNQQAPEAANNSAPHQENGEQEPAALSSQSLSPEQQQALQQWLRKVPDDPSGLLKRKFQHEFQKRQQLYQQGEWELPKNNAHQRY